MSFEPAVRNLSETWVLRDLNTPFRLFVCYKRSDNNSNNFFQHKSFPDKGRYQRSDEGYV